MKLQILIVAMSCSLAACAFFEEPLDDLGTVLPSAPATAADDSSSLPPPLPDSPVQDAKPAARQSAGATGETYFTVATLFDLPDDPQNISFVHFTDLNNRRGRAVCDALIDTYSISDPAKVPANASNLIVWPVSSKDTKNSCAEMLSNYEGIDISNKVAEKVKDNAAGPFMLSRNNESDQRMIYDFSSVNNRAMVGAVNDWQSLLSGPASNWPDFQSAK